MNEAEITQLVKREVDRVFMEKENQLVALVDQLSELITRLRNGCPQFKFDDPPAGLVS